MVYLSDRKFTENNTGKRVCVKNDKERLASISFGTTMLSRLPPI